MWQKGERCRLGIVPSTAELEHLPLDGCCLAHLDTGGIYSHWLLIVIRLLVSDLGSLLRLRLNMNWFATAAQPSIRYTNKQLA